MYKEFKVRQSEESDDSANIQIQKTAQLRSCVVPSTAVLIARRKSA